MDPDDSVLQAFLGPSSSILFLPESIARLVCGTEPTDENIAEIEKTLEFPGHELLSRRLESGAPWWIPTQAWAEAPPAVVNRLRELGLRWNLPDLGKGK